MKKQRRLQSPGDNPAPVHRLIKSIQLARVPERVHDKGQEAKGVEVCRVRCGPAAEQDVEPDAEIHQRDQAHAGVECCIGTVENDRNVEADAMPRDHIADRPIHLGLELLTGQSGNLGGRPLIGREQKIARLDARAFPSRVRGDTLRLQHPLRLHPPNTVGRLLETLLLLEVHRGEKNGCGGQQRQPNGDHTNL